MNLHRASPPWRLQLQGSARLRRVVLIHCSSRGGQDSGKSKGKNALKNPQSRSSGFAALATLLQERQTKTEKVAARTKPREKLTENSQKTNSLTVDVNNGRFQSTSASAGAAESNGFAKAFDTQANNQQHSRQQVRQQGSGKIVEFPAVSKEDQLFSEAVLAAMQQSALERRQQKLSKRHNNTRSGKRSSGQTAVAQESRIQVDAVKAIVVKPEWGGRMQDMQKKLDDLKQQYYNRV